MNAPVDPSGGALVCPVCGHENIVGVDLCEGCQHSLADESIGGAGAEHFALLDESIQVLGPRPPECVGRKTSIAEVITRLRGRNVGCVLVVGDAGELIGIFTERDVLYRVAGLLRDLEHIPVESLMTPQPAALKTSVPMSRALHLMGLHGFRHIPIVDDEERPTGFIAFRDIVRYIEENFARTMGS